MTQVLKKIQEWTQEIEKNSELDEDEKLNIQMVMNQALMDHQNNLDNFIKHMQKNLSAKEFGALVAPSPQKPNHPHNHNHNNLHKSVNTSQVHYQPSLETSFINDPNTSILNTTQKNNLNTSYLSTNNNNNNNKKKNNNQNTSLSESMMFALEFDQPEQQEPQKQYTQPNLKHL